VPEDRLDACVRGLHGEFFEPRPREVRARRLRKDGRAIEAIASARGHTLALVVDRDARGRHVARAIDGAPWRGVEVAFEFSEPASAKNHVLSLLRRGVAVVCGTTGWDAKDKAVRAAIVKSRRGAVIAPNFSVGMNLFYAVVADAARQYLAVGGYDPWIVEWHHRGKADAPSGTARRLAGIAAAASPLGAVIHEGCGQ
jgi:4-hydroxy-tetrahydrodipicolinate reductase